MGMTAPTPTPGDLPLEGRSPVFARLVVLAAVVTAAYATSIPGGFVWIDHVEIEQGGYRLTEGGDPARLFRLTLDQYLARNEGPVPSHGGYWRPCYAASISLDWWAWGARPWCDHLENILWHLAVCVGLLFLGQHYVADDRAVFWATLLFAAHPLGVHSVTWISGRKDTMCAAFGVAALLAFARAVESRPSWRAGGWYLLAAVSAAASALSKELGMVVAAAAALLLWCKWPRLSGRGGDRPAAIAGWAMLLAVPLAVAWYRHAVLGGFGLNARYPAASVPANMATFSTLIWEYAGRVLWPRVPRISDAWPVWESIGAGGVAAMLGLAAALAATAMGLFRRRPWAVAAAWAWVWLLPATGMIPLRHLRAERYLYPASWGLLLVAVLVILRLMHRLGQKWEGLPAKVVLTTACVWAVLVTGYSNTKWWDDETLFRQAVGQDPHFVEGWIGLADVAFRRDDYGKAIEYGEEAIRRAGDPHWTAYWSPWVAHTNLGLAYYHQRDYPAALAELSTALSYSPHSGLAHYHVGMAAFAMGDYALARDEYTRSLELRPGDFLAQSNLAATYLRLGDFRRSAELLGPLVKRRPDDAINRTNLASVLLAMRRYEDAIPHFQRLIEQRPDDPLALAKLAWCQWEVGQKETARTNWRRASRIAPQSPAVRSIGRLLGESP